MYFKQFLSNTNEFNFVSGHPNAFGFELDADKLNKIKDSINYKLKDVNITNNEKNIFVWPEWGFSDEEIVEFDKNNFTKINLWANILRTQTAWIVCWFYFVQKSL